MQNPAYTAPKEISQARSQVYKLLLPAPPQQSERLWYECKSNDYNSDQYFTLRAGINQYAELCVVKTMIKPDYKTASSYALTYACWLGDLELVKWIVEDLQETIDVSMLVDDQNAIEWAVSHRLHICDMTEGGTKAHKVRMVRAMDVCRFLIGHFGPKIDGNRPGGMVLRECTNCSCADVVVYLVRTYGYELVHTVGTSSDFILLIKHGYDTEAELYLDSYRNRMARYLLTDVLIPVTRYGSVSMFKTVIDMFRPLTTYDRASCIFGALCDGPVFTDMESLFTKVAMLLNLWKEQLIAPFIKAHLEEQLELSNKMRKEKSRMDERHGLTGQLIVRMCMDLVQGGEGIRTALALCCLPLNIELFDTVFSSKLDQIMSPAVLQQSLTVCAELGDMDMLAHILNRYKAFVDETAIDIWCHVGDIEALTMLFESGVYTGQPIQSSEVLVRPCRCGDEELVELLIRFIGPSMKEWYYCEAFKGACYNGHEGIIRILSACCDHIDFQPDAVFGLTLIYVRADIISLLNSIFGTTLDPSKGKR